MENLSDRLYEIFQNEETRYAYVEDFLNSSIAAQIKTLRGDMSQQELADKIGTKQSGISRLENVNYSAWKVETLRKLARAFGLRLRISFEEFGTLIPEIERFNRRGLGRRRYEDDPAFNKLIADESLPQDSVTAQAQALKNLLNQVDLSRYLNTLLEQRPKPREHNGAEPQTIKRSPRSSSVLNPPIDIAAQRTPAA